MRGGIISEKLKSRRSPLVLMTALFLAACGTPGTYVVPLMPAPIVFEADDAEAARARSRQDALKVYYATQRPPTKDGAFPYYENARAGVTRLGAAQLKAVIKDKSWVLGETVSEDVSAREVSLALSSFEELGILQDSLNSFTDPAIVASQNSAGEQVFAAGINKQLAETSDRDVVVYVHGYKVPFPDPILVSAEFRHFLNYDASFIAFSWPSTPKALAYFSDRDTAAIASRNLRDLLIWLDKNTNAKRIHILGYSLGSQLVMDALQQIALADDGGPDARLKLGQIILSSVDMDRGLLAAHLEDGVLDHVDGLTAYLSGGDWALSLTRLITARKRVGEAWLSDDLQPHVSNTLKKYDKLMLVDVSKAEGSLKGNGHGYFRGSPWVSSDIVTNLRFKVSPEERQLIRPENSPIWEFPEDYSQRITKAYPALKQGLTP